MHNTKLHLIQSTGPQGRALSSSDGAQGTGPMTIPSQPGEAAATRGEADRQLVQQAQRGDRGAFDLLVVRYQARVGAIISRYVGDAQDVMDLTQDAFVKAYRALPRFRGDSAFYTWLYRIAVNTAKNHLETRSRRPQSVMEAEDAENLEAAPQLRELGSPDRLLQRHQLGEALDRALAELPEDLRTALLLREMDGLSYEDIARVLECPIGTVRSRIFRAREAVDRHIAPLLEREC